jgi:tRNA dimethylallyltransferase
MNLFLVGPTACGKHEVSMIVAERLGAEILSIDSMKVYRGLDIGTAKPSAADRRRIRHHLIDIVDPSETYSAGRFVADAREASAELPVALLSGGTFLYYKAFVYGMFRGPAASAERRAELTRILKDQGPESLYRRLQRADPQAAARLHPNDAKRVIRALEVVETSGRPISESQTQWKEKPPRGLRAVALVRSREELRSRIEKRIDKMIAAGLIDESRAQAGRNLSREVRGSIGYKEALAHLRGELPLQRVREEMVRRTWLFCRKQLAWIRSLKELRALDVTGSTDPVAVASKVLDLLG